LFLFGGPNIAFGNCVEANFASSLERYEHIAFISVATPKSYFAVNQKITI